jgi:hypothetical protein
VNALVNIAKVLVIAVVALWIISFGFTANVQPNQIGVRTSATSGVHGEDFGPGWHLRIPGIHKMILLPSSYFMLDFTNDEVGPQKPLTIRTKDNNVVELDVSVPVRIKPGEGHALVEAGNHVQDADGRYRYMRLAEETATSVLREKMAVLESKGFYTTKSRVDASNAALEALNKQLAPMHLEAQRVLVREVRFRTEYEKQLTQIQLNEQNQLLDKASKLLAEKQQLYDNYQQDTNAQVAQHTQDWAKRQAEQARVYQVGLIEVQDNAPGAARKKLATLPSADVAKLRADAAKTFNLAEESVSDAHLIGIKNINAETLEYKSRVRAEADAIEARLGAEGDALVAKVQGEYENKLNALLGSPAGKAFVAWQAADNVKFADSLTFSSAEGIPSILRLRAFAEAFMGR